MSVAGSGGAARSPAATITAAPTPQLLVNLRLNSPAGQFTYSIKATTVTDAWQILCHPVCLSLNPVWFLYPQHPKAIYPHRLFLVGFQI
jgi:hypothetical protein